jgi:hypothetical protein
VSQEVELTRRQRLQQTGDEEDEVSPRHEVTRDLLLDPLERVRARCVDDLEIAQEVDRVAVDSEVLARALGSPGLAMAQDRDRPAVRRLA